MSQDTIAVQRRQIEQEVGGRTLCDLLAEHAEGHGDAPAMSWKRAGAWQTLSWRDYRERVAEVAMGLAGLGVGKGDFVAIMATNRPEHVLADQAAVHAGATPTSFYFTLAAEQLQYVAGHCEAKVAGRGPGHAQALAGRPRRPARPAAPGAAGRRRGDRRPGRARLGRAGPPGPRGPGRGPGRLRGAARPGWAEDIAALLYTSGPPARPRACS